MAYEIDKLSELALLLNFVLAKAFVEKGLESKLSAVLSVLSDSLFIREKKTDTVLQEIENAFKEIHSQQFIMYKYEVTISSKLEKTVVVISILNHDTIEIKSIKEMLKENSRLLYDLGYEAVLPF